MNSIEANLQRHPTDDLLELYSLGQLKENQTSVLDEHLLTCIGCQDRLTEIDNYVGEMKVICREAVRMNREPARGFFARLFQVPMPVWAGAAAALVLAAAVPAFRSTTDGAPETEVRLVATRGFEAPVEARGNVRLTISTTSLIPFPAYTLAVVDRSGREVWQTGVKPKANDISVRIPVTLDAGQYWIRLSGPSGEAAGEFSLNLR